MGTLIEMVMASGPSVLLIAVLIFFGKSFISYFFDKTIEVKKQELNQNLEIHKQQLNLEIEKYKSELDILKQKSQIRFSYLHAERAKVIKQVYYNLIELQSAMFDFTRLVQLIHKDADSEDKERIERTNKALGEFNRSYLPNKIFFSKSICQKIDKMFAAYWDKGWDFGQMHQMFKNRNQITHEMFKDYLDRSHKISDEIKNDFPPLIEELETEFRAILDANE